MDRHILISPRIFELEYWSLPMNIASAVKLRNCRIVQTKRLFAETQQMQKATDELKKATRIRYTKNKKQIHLTTKYK